MSRKVDQNIFPEIIDCFLNIANYHFFSKYIEKFKYNSRYTNLIPTQEKIITLGKKKKIMVV